eukprot:5773761-Prymnesium_polylepis.1
MRRVAVAGATRALRCRDWHECILRGRPHVPGGRASWREVVPGVVATAAVATNSNTVPVQARSARACL